MQKQKILNIFGTNTFQKCIKKMRMLIFHPDVKNEHFSFQHISGE